MITLGEKPLDQAGQNSMMLKDLEAKQEKLADTVDTMLTALKAAFVSNSLSHAIISHVHPAQN